MYPTWCIITDYQAFIYSCITIFCFIIYLYHIFALNKGTLALLCKQTVTDMKYLSFVVMMIISVSAFANQTKYILFEPNCMDRLEYQQNSAPTKYITYQIHTASGIIALEMGVENQKDYTIIPKGAIGCGNNLFDDKLVKSINNNLIDVYIIMPSDTYGHYHISPARMASYMSKDLQAGKIVRPDYDFSFAQATLQSTANLATSTSESQVFFMDEGSKCEAFHFRSISKNTCRPTNDFYYLNGVGIIKEKIGNTTAEANDNQYSLVKINGVTLPEFKAAHCQGNRIRLGLASKPELAQKAAPKPIETKAFVPKKCTNFEEEGHHLVQYGENLFSIARQEGLTIKQLRKWNKLKSTKILACSQLRVQPPTPTYTAAPKKKAKKKKFNVKGVKKPTKKYVNTHKPVKSTDGVHIVQKGENLYTLATLYGYTSERLAHMNGMEEGDILKPGMQLFTTDCNCPADGEKTHDKVEATSDKEMPVLSGSVPVPSELEVSAPKITSHVVQEGETIWSIANYYGYETQKLMDRNNLEVGEILIPGQKIYLPK